MKELSKNELYEKIREKVFFYVTYQKRAKAEVRRAFLPVFQKNGISNDMLEDLLEELEEKGYIDDKDFVRRKFNTYINLKLASINEIEYKIMQKGIDRNIIDDFVNENRERLYQYELDSAEKIYQKKITEKSADEVKNYLKRKGFSSDIVNSLE